MTTTPVIYPITVERIDRADWDSQLVLDGQHVVYGALGFTKEQFDPIDEAWDKATGGRESHPALMAWEAMLDEVLDEVHPKIADLFYEAINKRLPWTWEPER